MLMLMLTQPLSVARDLWVCVTLRLTQDPSSPHHLFLLKPFGSNTFNAQQRIVAKHSASVDLEFASDVCHFVSNKIMYSAQL